jgi:hypothetical protein
MSLVLPTVGRPTGRDPASWLDRVVRLVPIEILSPYLLAVEVARPTGPLALALVGVGLVATVAGLALHARHHRLAVAPGRPADRRRAHALLFAGATPAPARRRPPD